MKAVWSYWSKPFGDFYSDCWFDEATHLMSWVISLQTTRRFFQTTALYTDDRGADLLVNKLGLRFSEVHTELNRLSNADSRWWTLGKLYTYYLQDTPFMHLDADVYFWKDLPPALRSSDFFTQNPEEFEFGHTTWYRPEIISKAVADTRGWLPEEWTWFVNQKKAEALCCGIVGGNRTDFIRHYAAQTMRIMQHNSNRKAWSYLEQKLGFNLVDMNVAGEQYSLRAFLEYHSTKQDSPYYGMKVNHLFPSFENAIVPENAERVGYTHLLGGVKRSPEMAASIRQRMKEDYPEYYEKVMSIVSPEVVML